METAGTADPAGTRRRRRTTRLVRVKRSHLRRLRPIRPYPAVSDEVIACVFPRPEDQEEYRGLQAQAMAFVNKFQEENDDILRQFDQYGFAMREVEVSDSEDDDDVSEVYTEIARFISADGGG